MLYLNQGYVYKMRKRFFIEPNRNLKSDKLEFKRQCKENSKNIIFKISLTLAVIKAKLSKKNQEPKKLTQSSIVASIKTYYKGTILENNRTAIKPYELDIYLPKLNLAIEFNSIRFHSAKILGNAYYHIKKSIRCKRQGIRLIHIYEFEDYALQMRLLQDLILGKDNYPKNDFNKNNFLTVPKPNIIYKDNHNIIYGAGRLVSI